MCRIPGTWHSSSTVNITVEEFWQHRKKKKSCPWLLNNRASDCWTIVPATVEESYQWLLNNLASDCWTIVPVTVEQSYQWLLNNLASNFWTFAPVTVEESCQWLLKNYTSHCWRIVSVAVEELCQWLLKNCVSDCWRIVPTAVEQLCHLFFSLSYELTLAKSLPVFRVNTSIIINYFNSGSQLSKLQDYWLMIIFIFPLYKFYQPL